MKKRVCALVMAMVMVLSLFCSVPISVRADGGIVIKLHFNKPDGNYDGWSVWSWGKGMDGKDYPFAEENGEMVATITPDANVLEVGFIVRTQDWEKDIAEDQFIDIADVSSGTVDVYVESGVPGYTRELRDDVIISLKAKSAIYEDEHTIIAATTGKIEGNLKDAFTVQGFDKEVPVASVEETEEFTYKIIVEEELDTLKKYSIGFEGQITEVRMPIAYSTPEFEEKYTYTGNDLGAVYSKEQTAFRVWAPTASEAFVNLYKTGAASQSDRIEQIPMTADVNGTWIASKEGDLHGVYYTYTVVIEGEKIEACDPYARTTGVNGARGMIIDLDSTDPEGWEKDTNPHSGESITDAVIYELHMRDLSSDASAGIKNVGKFVQFTETETATEGGVKTGISHMKDLGVTHVHMLPMYDFGSVDENLATTGPFNWGYDPVNYNVPEGSYATSPYNGEVRVNEMKQMVKAMHDNGLSVVMDVVYNHVQSAGDFCFNKLVPGYFSRINADGSYSGGSGCGNDTASERSMVKKYIVESVVYWADEYHMDGFRFDLVGLLDTETINEIVEEVHKIRPDVIFYGEGWTMNTDMTKEGYTMATQLNSQETPEFAYFNDTIRDALKGNVFNAEEPGYVSGAEGMEEVIAKCFAAAADWCHSPSQTVNYASCHDNLTLYDRLATSRPDASEEDLTKMNNLSAAVYMLSEGIPFIHAGEEFLRSKVREDGSFDENSYSSGDEVNSIKWNLLEEERYQKVYDYYKGLIAFRKAHGALRLATAEEVAEHVKTVEDLDANVTAFEITGGVNGETAESIYVIFNANPSAVTVDVPEGKWSVCVNGEQAGTEELAVVKDGKAEVSPISAMVLVKGDTAAGGSFFDAIKNFFANLF